MKYLILTCLLFSACGQPPQPKQLPIDVCYINDKPIHDPRCCEYPEQYNPCPW